MIKEKISGFPSYGIEESKRIFYIIRNCQDIAIKNGFQWVECNTIELDKNLESDCENSKIRYSVSRDNESKQLGLRFDLTRGFMRWCLEQESKYNLPLRRFYCGKVFRGERSQKGRLKEFYQFDLDIVAKEIRQSDIDSIKNILIECVLINFPEIKKEELWENIEEERGQDYYTGNTFEIWYKGKSIIAGGGYEIPFETSGISRKNLPAFGGSIGIDRILDLIKE